MAAAREWLGPDVEEFLAACVRPPRLCVRANALKGGLPALERVLDREGQNDHDWLSVPWWPQALLPPPAVASALAGGPLARVGALYAQDPAALGAVAALDPQQGERILDLCAAPGGKSSAILDRLGQSGLLVANDKDGGRARELARTIERWGARHAAVSALEPSILAALLPSFFDRVLVDAPCSGEAMFARHPRAAADWSPRHVTGCGDRQRALLTVARTMVRPGGLLVYSTCTFNPYENEGVIADYLTTYPDDSLVDLSTVLPEAEPGRPDLLASATRRDDLTRCARLWPHKTQGMGHFIAAIRVRGDDGESHRPTSRSESRARDTRRATRRQSRRGPASGPASGADLSDARAAANAAAPGYEIAWDTLSTRGDDAYHLPPLLPVAVASSFLAPGVKVAERRGRTWRPAHALAMALTPDEACSTIALDTATSAEFLARRPTPVATAVEGLALATWQGYPLGWGRMRNGVLSSLIPTGLQS